MGVIMFFFYLYPFIVADDTFLNTSRNVIVCIQLSITISKYLTFACLRLDLHRPTCIEIPVKMHWRLEIIVISLNMHIVYIQLSARSEFIQQNLEQATFMNACRIGPPLWAICNTNHHWATFSWSRWIIIIGKFIWCNIGSTSAN